MKITVTRYVKARFSDPAARCNAEIADFTKQYRLPPYDLPRETEDFQCRRRATYLVNDETLCDLHAGRRLIELHMAENKTKR